MITTTRKLLLDRSQNQFSIDTCTPHKIPQWSATHSCPGNGPGRGISLGINIPNSFEKVELLGATEMT